jgi:hypothetical protein
MENLDALLRPSHARAVAAFMQEAFLEAVDHYARAWMCDPHYQLAWHGDLNALGTFASWFPALWDELWEAGTPQRGLSIVQYASCLACDPNPFLPLLADHPNANARRNLMVLCEQNTLYGEPPWLESNLSHVRSTFTPDFLLKRVQAAPLDSRWTSYRSSVARFLAEEPWRAEGRIETLLDMLSLREGRFRAKWDWDY